MGICLPAGTSTAYCWGDDPANGKPVGPLECGAMPGPCRQGVSSPIRGDSTTCTATLCMVQRLLRTLCQEPVTDPAGPTAAFPYDSSGGRSHVLRGGAWHLPPPSAARPFATGDRSITASAASGFGFVSMLSERIHFVGGARKGLLRT